MKIAADLHTHNGEVCGHADSTVEGLLSEASAKGHFCMALTDHGPRIDKTPVPYYLDNLKRPKIQNGVRLLCGIEADITLSTDGFGFDLSEEELLQLDWVIASYHDFAMWPGDPAINTMGYLWALTHPAVDCLGHIGRPPFRCDFEKVVKAAKTAGKTLEFNNHSFHFGETCCPEVMKLCMKHSLPVVITSDAHINEEVGRFPLVFEQLERIGFPEELVLNANKERLQAYLDKRAREKRG